MAESDEAGWLEILGAVSATAFVVVVFAKAGPAAGVCATVVVGIIVGFGRLMEDPPPLREDTIRLSETDDQIERWTEIQDSRYIPGYWTGGKIDPLLTVKRPNPYGAVLVLSAMSTVLVVFLGFEWPQVLLIFAICGVMAVAGFKLLRSRKPKSSRGK